MDIQEAPVPVSNGPKPKYFIKGIAVLLIIVISYYVGYQAGHKGFIFAPKSFEVISQNDAPTTVDYSLLWKAIDVLNQKYIDKPVDQQKILYGAVAGAVNAVGDPYTSFFTPEQLTNFQTQLAGSFGGIGAEVGEKDGNVVIIAPLDGTPAKAAGILAGDTIVAVDGKSTAGWSVDQAVDAIRGPKGTQVTIQIVRGGQDKPLTFKITRDTIVVKSVKWAYKTITANGQNKTVAVITISEFGDDTTSLVNQAVNDILTHNVSGIIVDLRNNPGGYLQSAVDVASDWVKQGDLVVSEAHSDGTSITYKGEGNPRLAAIKTIVMINGGSASAAEILSGALHDHGFAQLLGEKSFGKGSVQELVNLPGGSAVKVTIAKWITPNGVNLNHNGLTPDISVALTPDNANAGKDPQMDAALSQFSK
jgi:carboxyl-terminal processing protease